VLLDHPGFPVRGILNIPESGQRPQLRIQRSWNVPNYAIKFAVGPRPDKLCFHAALCSRAPLDQDNRALRGSNYRGGLADGSARTARMGRCPGGGRTGPVRYQFVIAKTGIPATKNAGKQIADLVKNARAAVGAQGFVIYFDARTWQMTATMTADFVRDIS
jgi:hypothetical protein